MRPRIEGNRRHKARGISLPPELERATAKRATELDLTFSKYVQRALRLALNSKTTGAGSQQMREAV